MRGLGRRHLVAVLPLSVLGIAATTSHVPWEDLTAADLLHDVLTRVTGVG